MRDDVLSRLATMPDRILSRVAMTNLSWIRVEIDDNVFLRLANSAEQDETERLISRALRLGASARMLETYFGLTRSDTAARRKILHIPPRRGRQKELNMAQQAEVWRLWKTKRRGLDENQITRNELPVMMEIAEELDLNLADLYAEIKHIQSDEAD
jgi:hypothetical protein